MNTHASKTDLCKAMFAGAVAGIVASAAMTRFHVALSGRGLTGSEEPQSMKPVGGGDDVAMRVADLTAEATTGGRLTREEKTEVGGPLAHYAFGAGVGAIYGLMCELTPDAPCTRGAIFGPSVWAGADQLALPLVGLTPWPLKAYPPATNLQHLASHVVYGIATAQAYAAIRRAL
jgi:uncharacterized membrane protein YagU involved in acid resistance